MGAATLTLVADSAQMTGLADGTAGSGRQTPADVNEADAAEQSRAVELDEEEYR